MDRREDYPKLEHQPLTLVLAEFRFRHTADISGFIADLSAQDSSFAAAFEERLTQQVEVGPEGISIRQPSKFWIALDPGKGQMIQVERDRLIIATTKYPRFDAFASQCLHYVSVLETSLGPEELMRVGLRYNDAVAPLEAENLGQYLHAHLLPALLLEREDAVLERHRSETLVRTQGGLLALRVLIGRHGLGVMPDLARKFPLELDITVPADRETAVLDFDHFWKPPPDAVVPFSMDEVEKRLRALHEAARSAFWEATTDFARRERWA